MGLNVSERYSLQLTHPTAVLTAETVWGALRGLETFSQLLQHNGSTGAITVLEQRIDDWPRFPFRAVMVDTARSVGRSVRRSSVGRSSVGLSVGTLPP